MLGYAYLYYMYIYFYILIILSEKVSDVSGFVVQADLCYNRNYVTLFWPGLRAFDSINFSFLGFKSCVYKVRDWLVVSCGNFLSFN